MFRAAGEGTEKQLYIFDLLSGDYGRWEMNKRHTERLASWLFLV